MARFPIPTRATPAFIGGVTAGITLAAFEMLTGAAQSGAAGFWMPLRMTSAIVLGPLALQSSYPIALAAVTGLLIHMLLSITFAFNFLAIVQPEPTDLWRRGIPVAATVFGLGLWIVNFYVLAPVLGWYWFPDQSDPLVQFFAHTFFYGSVLGVYLSRHRVMTGMPRYGID
jgi:hypothetical protein